MTLPNLVRSGACFALLLACSSQSIEAVGSASCLAAQVAPASCGGMGGTSGGGGMPSTGGVTGGTASGGAFSGGAASGGAGSGGAAGSTDSAGAPGEGSLLHRYSFDGTGTRVNDSVADADGVVVNATLDGDGSVSIADDRIEGNQTADQFVDLPNRLLSTLSNATLEVWFTWSGGGIWQRIIDFGDDTVGVEGSRTTGLGKSYLFVTPLTPSLGTDPTTMMPKPGVLRVAFAAARVHEVQLDATRSVSRNFRTHVAVVVDSDAAQMLLYMDGKLENAMTFPADSLPLINDVNDWLGRSNFYYDSGFNGTFHEFRIYSSALNAEQIRRSFDAGPDAPVPGL